MTLRNQIMISGFLILFFMFMGVLTFTLQSTQEFMNNQLDSHAQDTATALGVSLSLPLEGDDVTLSSRVVDAIWDRGFYQKIIILDMNDAPIIERSVKVNVEGVPEWFIKLFSLTSNEKDSLIMSGWSQIGQVYVVAHPGYAYQKLWRTLKATTTWFLITFVIAVIMGIVLLNMVLKPLKDVTKQAMSICQQKFVVLHPLPKTKDLQMVVVAMNKMSKKLKKMFEENTRITEQLRDQAFVDPVTKLGNRRYFDKQYSYIVKHQQTHLQGALYLIELKNFKQYNERWGYDAGDHLLKSTGIELNALCDSIENSVVAHLGGATFGILLQNNSRNYVEELANNICSCFDDFVTKGLVENQDIGHVGVALFDSHTDESEALSRGDMALRTAQSKGNHTYHVLGDVSSEDVHGRMDWTIVFKKAIEENRFTLFYQDVKFQDYSEHKHVHNEILMRMLGEDGSILPASVFKPMAEQLHLIVMIDRIILGKVFEALAKYQNDDRIFDVNISPSSIDDKGFRDWFYAKLKGLGSLASKLCIELPEYGVHNRIDLVREFFEEISSIGTFTAIDHYGKHFTSFTYLNNLRLNFLKIDGSYISQIDQDTDHQFFIQALINIAHGLGISVVAEAVETKEEYEILKELKVDGMQGFYLSKPKELEIS